MLDAGLSGGRAWFVKALGRMRSDHSVQWKRMYESLDAMPPREFIEKVRCRDPILLEKLIHHSDLFPEMDSFREELIRMAARACYEADPSARTDVENWRMAEDMLKI